MSHTGRRLSSVAGGLLLVLSLSAAWRGAPASASEPLWLAPAAAPTRATPLATALRQLADGKAEAALPALKTASRDAAVGAYARVHQGRAELAMGRVQDAATSAQAALDGSKTPYLKEQALWLAADAAEVIEDWPTAFAALSALAELPSTRPAQAWYRLGVVSREMGRAERAREAWTRVYDGWPLSDEAADAGAELARLDPAFRSVPADRVAAELRRAQVLFDARRLPDARRAWEALRPVASGDTAQVVSLRLAQLDALQKRLPAAHTALSALVGRTEVAQDRRDEAEYYRLGVMRDQGRHDEYIAAVRAFAARPSVTPAWAEAAMNDLGTHFILTDADALAAQVFTEQYDRFPTGSFAPRAAWKAGWWAFTTGAYAETSRLFESAAVTHRRSDYRSGWVYWAARAHERAGRHEEALAGYAQTITDYGSSYYGREASRARDTLLAAHRPAGAGPVTPVKRDAPLTWTPGAPPATARTIQALLEAQMWDDAIGEVRRAQRDEGTTPLLEATLAYAYHHKGELRLAISAMKRAYPQYLAEGAESLPREIRTIIFPLEYWDLIQTHAKAHDLDPFLIAALMAQESTFDAKIRSAANAWGLMQILPSTGARVARTLGIRPFSTASLTRPETNVRIGTKYFADLVRRYNGDTAAALAAYNAGENRVDRWLKERPGLDRDEFVDGIPFPETQGYVKKILGTADDYRTLYRLSGSRR